MGVAAVRSDFVWSPALIVREYTMVTGSLFERLETFPVIVTTVPPEGAPLDGLTAVTVGGET